MAVIKWKPWPQLLPSRKFEARIRIRRLSIRPSSSGSLSSSRFSVEIEWKGIHRHLRSLSRRRNFTREEEVTDGAVCWDGEEFRSLCRFFFTQSAAGEGGDFLPWNVCFAAVPGPNKRNPVLHFAALNIAGFISSDSRDNEISIPLSLPNATISLHVSVSLVERRSEIWTPRSPFSLRNRVDKRSDRDESSSDGRSSENRSSPDFDSFDDDGSEESGFGKSFNYGTLIYANHVGDLSASDDGDLVYYSHRKPDEERSYCDETAAALPNSVPRKENLKLRLPWSKRKKSPPSECKGEPLIKRHYGEEGGDDIDFDRRQHQLTGSTIATTDEGIEASVELFGDDNFAIGAWEYKEITSRDGRMKLRTQVFFASIDQRSFKASGESACTALVAVVADWFHANRGERTTTTTPIRSQFDALIREGSFEWRKLCEQPAYAERFPDKHFDLETVLEAGIRPLSVVPEKSFVGFFRPDAEGITDEERRLDFLRCAMSFDAVWDEIAASAAGVYIISWNDHFFVLKVEADACYVVDTLGERLHEGCDRAFILKFDQHTEIIHGEKVSNTVDDDPNGSIEEKRHDEAGRGKEACREYIKGFLAAIPIRELEEDLKRNRAELTTQIHHRLQIECHYTTRFSE